MRWNGLGGSVSVFRFDVGSNWFEHPQWVLTEFIVEILNRFRTSTSRWKWSANARHSPKFVDLCFFWVWPRARNTRLYHGHGRAISVTFATPCDAQRIFTSYIQRFACSGAVLRSTLLVTSNYCTVACWASTVRLGTRSRFRWMLDVDVHQRKIFYLPRRC